MKVITSLDNLEIKHIVKLHDAKHRRGFQQFIIEGFNAVKTAIDHGLKLEDLYLTENHVSNFEIPTTIVTEKVLQKISTVKSPSGILGVFEMPAEPKLSELSSGLVLAQISDPGNMGTLIRSAAAFGIKSVVVIEGVDPYSPKVVQSSAGTISMVKIFQLDWPTLVKNKQDLKLSALVVDGGKSPDQIDKNSSLLVVGSEAHGIPADWLADCDQQITIPMPGQTESLNAAVAGSIAMYLLRN